MIILATFLKLKSMRNVKKNLFLLLLSSGWIIFLIFISENYLKDSKSQNPSWEIQYISENTDTLSIDFNSVEYFPYIKSKIWFWRNMSDIQGYNQAPFLDELWPGIMCNNIEFDQWFKNPQDLIHPALETLPKDPTLRPKILLSQPTDWLREYESMLGDKNISILFQLTGAPAQYQVGSASDATRHPTPTDIPASAALIADWTAWENHSYPIKWSLWNEPGHTLNGIDRFQDSFGNKIYEGESKEDFEIRQEQQKEFSAEIISEMYEQYSQKMSEKIYTYSQFGLASFLGVDFSPNKLNSEEEIYFKYFIDAFEKISSAPVDYLTFNSFWGGWVYILNGVRNVLWTENKYGPIIFTQYAPALLKESEEANQKNELDPMIVTLQMMKDIFQFERATDLQHVCLAYWFWKEFWILRQNKKDFSLEPNYSYQALKLFSQLPSSARKVDYGNTELSKKWISAYAWMNYARAAVYFMNESSENQDIPLTLKNLPSSFLSRKPTLEILNIAHLTPRIEEVQNSYISLPARSIALLSYDIVGIQNPLIRRNSLSLEKERPARFLQTRSFTDRQIVDCENWEKNSGVKTCTENTGTYGFFDSVRSIAYLGQWSWKVFPKILMVYENLPQKIYINRHIFAEENKTSGYISVQATASWCINPGVSIKIPHSQNQNTDAPFLNLATLFEACGISIPIELSFEMQNFIPWSQAEIYLSAQKEEAKMIDIHISTQHPNIFPTDTQESLLIPDWESYKNNEM